jgi:hypothetical protein
MVVECLTCLQTLRQIVAVFGGKTDEKIIPVQEETEIVIIGDCKQT